MEDTPLYSGKSRLLRIDVTHKLGNDTVSETLWTDAAGEIQKTRMELLNSMAETFRVSKEAALAEAPVGDLDLIRTISVPVSRPLESARHAAHTLPRAPRGKRPGSGISLRTVTASAIGRCELGGDHRVRNPPRR